MEIERMNYLRIYPKHQQAREAFQEIFRVFPSIGKFKIPSLTIDLVNGDRVMYRSCQNPDALRGIHFTKVWVDEMVDSPEEFEHLERP